MSAETKTEIHTFRIGEGYGQMMTDLAREKSWETGSFNDGVVFLIESFYMPLEMAKKVVNGELKMVENIDKQDLSLVEDNWSPGIEGLKEELEAFISDVMLCWRKADMGTPVHYWKDVVTICGIQYKLGYDNLSKVMVETYGIRNMMNFNIKNAHSEMRSVLWSIDDFKVTPEGIELWKTGQVDEFNIPTEVDRAEVDDVKPIEEPQFKDVEIIDDTKNIDRPNGWLSPEGKFFSCEVMEHTRLAMRLAEKYGLTVADPQQDLMQMYGWWECTYGGRWMNLTIRRISQKQVDFLLSWLEKYSRNKETMEIQWHGQNYTFNEFLERVEVVDVKDVGGLYHGVKE